MSEEEIIQQVLYKLDGWVLNSDEENIDEIPNKKVTATEILHFYTVALDYAKAYTQKTDLTAIVGWDTAVYMWTAGLIWEKYNIRVNNQEDDTNPFGYGDKLIWHAKEMLKPNKEYQLYAY